MKAAFIERHGGPEVLEFGDMPDPVAASREVVIDIVAASVNGADWKVREGKSNQLSQFPYILGQFPESFQQLGMVLQTCALVTRSSASATLAKRAPMRRRLRSGQPSWQGRPITCRILMPQR